MLVILSNSHTNIACKNIHTYGLIIYIKYRLCASPDQSDHMYENNCLNETL